MKLPNLKIKLKASPELIRMMLIVAICVGVSVFCLAGAKNLASKSLHQGRIIKIRNQTLKQLKADKSAASTLSTQYTTVLENSSPRNIIGGKNDQSVSALPPDVDNARVILDALPPTYDFPSLIVSMSKILSSNGVTNPGVAVTDQSTSVNNSPSDNPQPTPIAVPISGLSSYTGVQNLIHDLERSIRPFDVTNLELTGSQTSLSFNINANTYYQQAKSVNLSKKVVH